MKSKLISFIRRKIFRINRYRWDYQYSTGQWDDLGTKEKKRLYVARDFLKKYTFGGNILEIGCGEGDFFQNVREVDFAFYEGIDISEVAISRIRKTGDSIFLGADMERYVPTNFPFSIIVFNEVLYYSKNPLVLLKRYSQYLSKNGVFLIGMYDTKKSTDIWLRISKVFTELDSVKIQEDQKGWNYKVLKLK